MKVRKLSSSCREDLEQHLQQVEEEIKKFASLVTKNPILKITLPSKHFETEQRGKEIIRVVGEFLNRKSFWECAEHSPTGITFPNAKTSEQKSFGNWTFYGMLFVFKNCLYDVTGTWDPNVGEKLVLERVRKEENKMAFLLGQGSSETPTKRIAIPEEVRHEVWRRDKGICIRCGSRKNLEFDHIVPVSRGGSNTARNIELLCEACNRSKGASI